MTDPTPGRKLTATEADQVLARAASLDAEGEAATLSPDDLRESALAAGIAPHAVELALKEARALPALTTPSGRFMGLTAIPRAAANVARTTAPTVSEVATRLRAVLGPDAKISEELGTVRAKMEETVVTVVPGTTTFVSVSADKSDTVAITGLAAVVGGIVSGLFSTLMVGLGGDTASVLIGLGAGGVLGIVAWQMLWREYLRRKARTVNAIASVVAAALERD